MGQMTTEKVKVKKVNEELKQSASSKSECKETKAEKTSRNKKNM